MELAIILGATGLLAGFAAGRMLLKKSAPDSVVSAPERSDINAASEQLKRDVRDMASMLSTLDVPVSKRDANGNVTYCNVAFCEIAEETSDEANSIADLELFAGQKALAIKAFTSGETQHVRRHIVAEGKRLLFDIYEIPCPSEGIVVGYALNVSELEMAQEEIQRHISALRDLLESSTAAMAIYGRDGRLKYYNMAFMAVWKLEEHWLEQEPHYGEILEALREKRKLPEQANFAAFKQAQLKLFTSLIEPDESFYYLPDGKILRAVAIPHALGGILFVYEDVTDRVALERSYNTLIAVQRETLDNLHEGVAVFTEDGRLRLCNPMFHKIWQLGEEFTASEPHMRDWLEASSHLFVTKDWQKFCDDLVARLQQRQFMAMRFDRADASVIDCASVPLPDGATLITFIDVTDSTLLERSLREKNEALEAADRVKTEFLANMSYELRSPLTSISGFAEMLSKSYIGPLNATQAEYVGHIFESSQQLSALVSAIIDLATIEAGYMQLNQEPCNISELVQHVCELSASGMASKQLQIDYQPAASVTNIIGDAVRIKQMVLQLINTSARYAKPGSVLVVRTGLSSEALPFFSVQASTRIPAATLATIIDDASAGKTNASASELGMTMVAKFASLHHGSLHVHCDDAYSITITVTLGGEEKK